MLEIIKNSKREALEVHLCRSLPGNTSRSVSYEMEDLNDIDPIMILVPEYCFSFVYEGVTYTKKAFPFGNMTIKGDVIPNEESLETMKEQMEEELEIKISERTDEYKKTVWKLTNKFTLGSLAILGLSIIVSFAIKSLLIVIIVFLCAFASFVLSKIYVKKIDNAENEKSQQDIKKFEDEYDDELTNFSKNHKKKLQNALNEKLISLNLKTVTDDNICNNSNKE